MADITLGLVGLILLILAWIPQTLDILRTKTSRMNPNFALLYLAGSGTLTYYAWAIGDMVFMMLNGFAMVASLINFYYSLVTFRRERTRHRVR